MRRDPFDFPIKQVVECPPYKRRSQHESSPTARLDLIPGRKQQDFEGTHLMAVGLGAQSIVVQGFLRSGGRRVTGCDGDFFELSNFSRQLGYSGDRGHPKAHRVARNLRRDAVNGATITSIACPFPEALAYIDERPDVISCLVDDNSCRLAVAEYGLKERIPVIIAGLSRDGLRMYAFLQLPTGSDYGDGLTERPCLIDAVGDLAPVRLPCVAATIKTGYLEAAHILNFIDIAVMGWSCDAQPYNLVYADLNNRIEGQHLVTRRPGCWLCGGA